MSAFSQWIRKVGLFVARPGIGPASPDIGTPNGDAIDLSAFRIRFNVNNADIESPNSASIRVYNLSRDTLKHIRGEFSEVILNAGYENGNYGIIFRGTIKQFRFGRENATDSYLDIFASDGDIGYNQGVVNTSLAKGATPADMINNVNAAMPGFGGVDFGSLATSKTEIPNIRGVVLMGMARARMRNIVTQLDSGWSIQDGRVVITPNTGYRDGEAVVINVGTGLIGVPEQTDSGVKLQCLLNSKLRIGGRVKLNNEEIVQLVQQNPNDAPIAYNQYAGFQRVAGLSPDGMYRAFMVEHEGDSRGTQWHTNIVCLAVNETAPPQESVRFE